MENWGMSSMCFFLWIIDIQCGEWQPTAPITGLALDIALALMVASIFSDTKHNSWTRNTCLKLLCKWRGQTSTSRAALRPSDRRAATTVQKHVRPTLQGTKWRFPTTRVRIKAPCFPAGSASRHGHEKERRWISASLHTHPQTPRLHHLHIPSPCTWKICR